MLSVCKLQGARERAGGHFKSNTKLRHTVSHRVTVSFRTNNPRWLSSCIQCIAKSLHAVRPAYGEVHALALHTSRAS